MKKNWETYQEKLILKSATPYLLLYAIFVFILLMGLILLNWGQNPYNQAVEPNSPIQAVAHLPINTDKPYKVIKSDVSAYTASKDECSESLITASGETPKIGMAACPRFVPLGKFVEINGKTYRCADHLNIRYKNTFDILMATKQEARNWGRKSLTVKIYE
jgi:3D (Asp-Asp-Asp) domain-containing protein